MSRKKKVVDLTKNQALRDILPFYKTAQELADKIGLTKQSISIVRNDHQPIFESMIVYIKKKHPEIALKYWRDEMIIAPSEKVSEPSVPYELKQKKTERFESELKLLIDLTQELRTEVKRLKDDVERLKLGSK